MTQPTRIQYASGALGKSIAARLLPGTDLLTGIEELCRENGISFAQIATCFGSLQRSGYYYLVPDSTAKLGASYGPLQQLAGPIEFLNGTGFVCQREGDYEIHLHGTIADQTGKVFGGHFVKSENPVYTVDLLVTEVTGMNLLRAPDSESGVNQLFPVTQGSDQPFHLKLG
ncbi:MAG TPA: PPC domain-containing DNA-binding protein [Planococcus sp. (in: firmicutes)]|nr:PPC domain-containing DNA-binding protein [Planococcus sp. (in: firmicutes)]